MASSLAIMAVSTGRWDKRHDGERLKRAREFRDHTQEDCVVWLHERGAHGVDQAALSKYEMPNGRTPRRPTASLLLAYIAEVEPNDTSTRADPGQESEEFERVVRQATGDPLLGPRQGEFVDAITYRLRHGPPMSPDDTLARSDQMRILRLNRSAES